MSVGDRIKYARQLRGYTQEELGLKIGVQKSAIAKYENERVTNIKRNAIRAIAEELDVSPAWLLGFDSEEYKSAPNFGKRIKERRVALGISADELADMVSLSRTTIFRYESGDIFKIDAAKLQPIADVLHTTPAALMGWEEQPPVRPQSKLVSLVQSVPDDMVELVYRVVSAIIQGESDSSK